MGTMIELPEEVERRIDALVDETGRSKEFYIEDLLWRMAEDIEDYYRAIQIIGPPEGRGGRRMYSSEEIRREFGLDDEN